ncbi:MAG TPA: hypothetical protein VIL09_17725 [Microvirga sp.]|jgi:hypothetical protein
MTQKGLPDHVVFDSFAIAEDAPGFSLSVVADASLNEGSLPDVTLALGRADEPRPGPERPACVIIPFPSRQRSR